MSDLIISVILVLITGAGAVLLGSLKKKLKRLFSKAFAVNA